MTEHELMTLLSRARKVLDRYLFEDDGETIRDDVAEVCMAIDDVIPFARAARPKAEAESAALEPSTA
jgi:hypothetical protein